MPTYMYMYIHVCSVYVCGCCCCKGTQGEKHGVLLKGLALSRRQFMEKKVGGEDGHISQGALE